MSKAPSRRTRILKPEYGSWQVRDASTGQFPDRHVVSERAAGRAGPISQAAPIEPDVIAEQFNMTKPALAATLGLGRNALTRKDRADARKSQQRLREVLEIIALVRDWAGGDSAAMSWYRAVPIPAFGGRTAEAVVKDGNAHLVREYVDHLALGGYA